MSFLQLVNRTSVQWRKQTARCIHRGVRDGFYLCQIVHNKEAIPQQINGPIVMTKYGKICFTNKPTLSDSYKHPQQMREGINLLFPALPALLPSYQVGRQAIPLWSRATITVTEQYLYVILPANQQSVCSETTLHNSVALHNNDYKNRLLTMTMHITIVKLQLPTTVIVRSVTNVDNPDKLPLQHQCTMFVLS